jgi:hypothetical protein
MASHRSTEYIYSGCGAGGWVIGVEGFIGGRLGACSLWMVFVAGGICTRLNRLFGSRATD